MDHHIYVDKSIYMHKWSARIIAKNPPFFPPCIGIRGIETRNTRMYINTHIYKHTYMPTSTTTFYTYRIPSVHHSAFWACRTIAWHLKYQARQIPPDFGAVLHNREFSGL